jgi:hypothetical protein
MQNRAQDEPTPMTWRLDSQINTRAVLFKSQMRVGLNESGKASCFNDWLFLSKVSLMFRH